MVKGRVKPSQEPDSAKGPHETPSQDSVTGWVPHRNMVSGDQHMRFMAENGKAEFVWQDTPKAMGAIDRSPDDSKKQSATPVRRGRQPEMSGQLGGSLMSLKCQ